MTSYPFISSLFTAILSKSKSIEGRFYVCPKLGNEINSDDLGQVIQENTERLDKKYPLVLMMPPTMRGSSFDSQGFLTYSITLFFLRTTYYGEGNVINELTRTSMRPIMQDWADMEGIFQEFYRALTALQAKSFHAAFRVGERSSSTQPISSIGVDRASGIRADFALQLPYGCEPLSDYEDINLIEIPV